MNMQDVAIQVNNLGKTYKLGRRQPRYRTLREAITDFTLAPLRRLTSSLSGYSAADYGETIWALKDVSFDIKQGEIVGIIGRNGAGKSTLLKILSSITSPTTGSARIHGRVSSLLEVGTGFHPELTGRENIFLNGAILGMKRNEISRKYEEIVSFAGLDKFIDTPVKHYSSGMYMRLAFAVAAHLESDVLLIDEVLAVGDINFQRKCIQKMGEVSSLGQTVVLVSHNLRVVETLTSRCIYLKDGVIGAMGVTRKIIEQYQRDALSKISIAEVPAEYDRKISSPVVFIKDFKITDMDNSDDAGSIYPYSRISVTCTIASNETINDAVICLIFCKDRLEIAANNSRNLLGNLSLVEGKTYEISVTIHGLWFVPGNYTAVLFVLPDYFSNTASSVSEIILNNFIVKGSKNYGGGYVSVRQDWKVEEVNESDTCKMKNNLAGF